MPKVPHSPFTLDNFTVTESHISRKPLGKKKKFDLQINPSAIIHDKTKIFELILKVFVSEKSERFKAHVEAHGFFSYKDVSEDPKLKDLFYFNAPAIIYPYIRAYISSLTALSGMEAITIPVLIMGGLKKELEENTITLTEEE